MTYRALRDVLGWPEDRLALAEVTDRARTQHTLVLARGSSVWMILDHGTGDIASAERRLAEGWRIKPVSYEPAASPSAPWVLQVRDSVPSFAR